MAFTYISIAIEVALLFLIYRTLFFIVLKRAFKQLYEKQTWWDYLTTFEGTFVKDTQIEIVYVTLLGLHHSTGGFLMLYGVLYDNPVVWCHGALWELVDDIHDLMCISFLWWPFEEFDLPKLVVMGAHHMFGMIIIVPVLTSELYLDRDLQYIGIALLLAGSVSCIGLVISRTMDRRVPKEAWIEFFMWLFNLLFFSFCRFYIYPKHLYRFFVTTNWERNDKFIIAAICMAMFNVPIFFDALKGTYDRLLVALNAGEKHSSQGKKTRDLKPSKLVGDSEPRSKKKN